MGGGQGRDQLHGHRDPFSIIGELAGRLARLWCTIRHQTRRVACTNGNVIWMPAAHVIHTGDQLKVMMDLPGVRKEDIDVVVSHGNLVIRGGRAVEGLTEDERLTWTTRDIGRFYRRITLPPGVTALEMATTFDDGVFRACFPLRPLQRAHLE
jgi:HSP20 family protein